MPYKTGMAIPHIYFKDYGKSKIYCPNFEQQVKIASQIDLIESKIEIETQLLNKYEEQKKFLLSSKDMLSVFDMQKAYSMLVLVLFQFY